jgi:hypothetical protein
VDRTYRHFWSADLEKGMKTFLAEGWELWPDIKFTEVEVHEDVEMGD